MDKFDSFYSGLIQDPAPWSPIEANAFAEKGPLDFADPPARPGSPGLPGVQIIWEDLSESYIYVEDLFADYDPANPSDWSMKIPVVNGSFDKLNIAYDNGTNLYEDNGGTPPLQTLYRFKLIKLTTDSNGDPLELPLSVYGQYREVTLCVDGNPRQTLIKTT